MGATWETVAFVLLALGSRDQQQQAYAMAHQILFLLAPLWVNAFSYMTLARTAHFFLPHRAARPRDDAHPGDGRARLDASPSDRPPTVLAVRSTAISKLFVWADVVTFLVQATGGVMINPDPSQAKTSAIGLKVYMVGVGIQQGCILCFTAMVARFEWKMRRLEGCVADARRRRGDSLEAGRSSLEEYGGAKKGWRPVTYAQYAVLVAISVRIIFRIAECTATRSTPSP
ncbi:hypothetical protein VTK73DRAFT_6343 [Phialemonium thermophilum]|uniref:Uncharacterized protein n=1 Tax=Phialemonium thermophilum TaxID=223376 RepID=A0ABR3V096_9PEZI